MQSLFVRRNAFDALRNWPPNMPRAQAVITSPPYYGCRDYEKESTENGLGVNHTGNSKALGHEDTPFEFVRNLASVFGNTREAHDNYLQRDGSLVVIIGDTFARESFRDPKKIYPPIAEKSAIGIHHLFVSEMRMRGWRLWQECIWNKPSAPPSGATQQRCNPVHEYILWFDLNVEDKPKCNTFAMREEGKTAAGKTMPPVGGKKYGDNTKTLISDGKCARKDVFSICPSRNNGLHVAPFPEKLVKIWIEGLTDEHNVVCDPFAGSRTVAKVAVEMRRRCVSFDLIDWVHKGEIGEWTYELK